MTSEDADLIRDYLDGDPEAIVMIDDWIARAASSFRFRLRPEWDDVLQECRLEIMRLLRMDKFRGDSSFKTYLWRVVNHTCIDRIRAQNRNRIHSWEEENQPGAEGLLDPTPAAAGRHAESDLLFRVLSRCSEDCRKLWGMILQGFSYREMSQRIGVSEGTLRVRVLRCRRYASQVRRSLIDLPPNDCNQQEVG